jgi:hypothetical protein
MFVRYLGGGIGHLEQFPPANNDYEDPVANNNGDVEVEVDDFGGDGGRENYNNEGGEDEGEEDQDEEGEGGDEDEEEDEDPGELSDNETGNVY